MLGRDRLVPALAAALVVLGLVWFAAGRDAGVRPQDVRRIDPGTWARPNVLVPHAPGPASTPLTPSHGDQAETGFSPGGSPAGAATDETYSVPGRTSDLPAPPAETTSTP
jgi:hypothetical protein